MRAKRWMLAAVAISMASTAFATEQAGCRKDDWRYDAKRCGHEQPAPQPIPQVQGQTQGQTTKVGVDITSSPVGVGQAYVSDIKGGEGGKGGDGGAGGLGVGQGYGGDGGQGVGISDSASKAKSDSAASVKDVKAEGAASAGAQAGGATLGDVGNSTITDNSRYLSFVPVQVAPLPQTITVGGLQLQALGECGPRYIIKPFARQTHTPQLFGLFNSSIAVETMHGTVEGLDEQTPFVYREVTLPAPFNERIALAIGHQLYLSAGSDGQGGGSSGAGNYASERAFGLGASLNANHAYGVVGVVAAPCVYRKKEARDTPPPVPVLPPPPVVKCPEGTRLVNGVCIRG